MIQELKIELNNKIISNEHNTNYSYMVNIIKFQTEILSDLDAYIELKNRSENLNEFILDYNRFLNNYTIYSFPIDRDSRNDKNDKYLNISTQGIDDDDSKAVLIWRQKSNINFKLIAIS